MVSLPSGQQITSAISEAIPKIRSTPIVANIERIIQSSTDFIRGNPIVSTAIVGAGTTGLIAAGAIISKRRKAPKKVSKRKKKTKKRKAPRKRRKRTKAQLRALRLRNLAKGRRKRKTGKRRRGIIRGRGLGSREIRHSGKSTKGEFKVVSFRDKKTGKMVRFKARK